MTTELDRAIKSAVSDIIAAAPDIADDPDDAQITATAFSTTRRLLPAAAVMLVVAAGVTGIALASRSSPSEPGPAGAEQPAGPTQTEPESGPTAPATTAAPDQTCSGGTIESPVPNVAGMLLIEAVDTLRAADADFAAVQEGATADAAAPAVEDGYVVVRQNTPPGSTLACGDVVQLTVGHRAHGTYTTQAGDTWGSIAAMNGIPVEDLLDFNGVTIAGLEAQGKTVTSPLEVGRVIKFGLPVSMDGTAPPTTG